MNEVFDTIAINRTSIICKIAKDSTPCVVYESDGHACSYYACRLSTPDKAAKYALARIGYIPDPSNYDYLNCRKEETGFQKLKSYCAPDVYTKTNVSKGYYSEEQSIVDPSNGVLILRRMLHDGVYENVRIYSLEVPAVCAFAEYQISVNHIIKNSREKLAARQKLIAEAQKQIDKFDSKPYTPTSTNAIKELTQLRGLLVIDVNKIEKNVSRINRTIMSRIAKLKSHMDNKRDTDIPKIINRSTHAQPLKSPNQQLISQSPDLSATLSEKDLHTGDTLSRREQLFSPYRTKLNQN